jgi:hypothetical protein
MDDRTVELGPMGEGHQLGALNLITPQKRKQAMALARTSRPSLQGILAATTDSAATFKGFMFTEA